jgi:hypothetical protein
MAKSANRFAHFIGDLFEFAPVVGHAFRKSREGENRNNVYADFAKTALSLGSRFGNFVADATEAALKAVGANKTAQFLEDARNDNPDRKSANAILETATATAQKARDIQEGAVKYKESIQSTLTEKSQQIEKGLQDRLSATADWLQDRRQETLQTAENIGKAGQQMAAATAGAVAAPFVMAGTVIKQTPQFVADRTAEAITAAQNTLDTLGKTVQGGVQTAQDAYINHQESQLQQNRQKLVRQEVDFELRKMTLAYERNDMEGAVQSFQTLLEIRGRGNEANETFKEAERSAGDRTGNAFNNVNGYYQQMQMQMLQGRSNE